MIALTAFLDDTALEADLILPTQVDVERFRAAEPVGLPIATLSLAHPAVRARGAARHPGDIILALGTALGHEEALPWESYSDAVKSALDARQDELTARGFDPVWAKAVERGGIWGDSPPTGQTVPPTTAFEAPTPAKPRPPGRGNELTLLPFESPKYGDGRGANRPWLQELPDTLTTVMWDGWAELATADAERLGIRSGDLLSLSSDHGSIQIPAILRPEARPGTVAVPLGMGHADFCRYAKGRGANPLDLVAASDIEGTRQPVVSGIRVLVERLGPGELALFGRGLREAEEIPTGWAPMASHEEKV